MVTVNGYQFICILQGMNFDRKSTLYHFHSDVVTYKPSCISLVIVFSVYKISFLLNYLFAKHTMQLGIIIK